MRIILLNKEVYKLLFPACSGLIQSPLIFNWANAKALVHLDDFASQYILIKNSDK